MRLSENQLRQLIRQELQRPSGALNEGLWDALKGLVGALFGNLGKTMTGSATEYRGELAGKAQETLGASQEALGRKEAKAWEDLKPHDDNIDKAVWAIAIAKAAGEVGSTVGRIGKAFALTSLAPPTPEEADEWEKGEDANNLEVIYKGIGEVKGLMEWLGTHLSSAKQLADEMSEDAPLEEQLQTVAEIGKYLSGELATGLESAIGAVDKAEGYEGFSGTVSNITKDAEQLTQFALEGVTHVKELQKETEEAAATAEEAAPAERGMPETLLRKYVRTLLS